MIYFFLNEKKYEELFQLFQYIKKVFKHLWKLLRNTLCVLYKAFWNFIRKCTEYKQNIEYTEHL